MNQAITLVHESDLQEAGCLSTGVAQRLNKRAHYGPKHTKKHRQNSYLIINCPTIKGVSEVSAVERTSKASRAEQVNEKAVQANEQTEERVAIYLHVCILDCSGPLWSFLLMMNKNEKEKKRNLEQL